MFFAEAPKKETPTRGSFTRRDRKRKVKTSSFPSPLALGLSRLVAGGVLFGQTESENMQKRPTGLDGVSERKPNNPDQACMTS
jgi:hypothetical protein